MYNIVLVHVGTVFPTHINDCIEQLIKFNKKETITVLIDRRIKHNIIHDVKIVELGQIKPSQNHITFQKTNRLDSDFMNGFWKYATERFFYLDDYISNNNLENVVHLENDNLIYVDINDLIPILEKFKVGLTFDNDNRCVPGFVFFKNKTITNKLSSHILTMPNKNDMETLSEFRHVISIEDYLPIIPDVDYSLISKDGEVSNKDHLYYKYITDFDSVFDAASIGQYLGGIDPIHSKTNTDGWINDSCLFNPSSFTYEWINDENNNKIPYMIYKNKKYKINNLHIHSKNLRRFM